MRKNKKYSLKKKLQYELDEFISKGMWAQLALLMGVVLILIFIFAIVILVVTDHLTFQDSLWDSLMHIIDQGTITGDEPESTLHLLTMLIITIVGMAFTSAIVGITASGVSNKMNELNKGRSAIIEKNHVVILGFNDNTHTIKKEIMDSNYKESGKHHLVIVDDLPKDEMERIAKDSGWSSKADPDEIAEASRKEKKTTTLFRSGDLISENTFDMCSVDRAKSIIVNGADDLETIKILLALSSYLTKAGAYIGNEEMPSVIALIHDAENLSAAKIAAGISQDNDSDETRKQNEYKVRIIYFKDMFARLFARVCSQPGLTMVMSDLINSADASFYIDDRKTKEYVDKNIVQIYETAKEVTPVGFMRVRDKKNIETIINPPVEEKFAKDDMLIYLADNKEEIESDSKEKVKAVGEPATEYQTEEADDKHYLVVGRCVAVSGLVENLHMYSEGNTCIDVISSENIETEHANIIVDDPYEWENMKLHMDEHPYWFDKNDKRHLTNIIIFGPDDVDMAKADEKVMVLLLNIREYIGKVCDFEIVITTEAKLPKNQTLMQNMSGSDLVVGTQVANRFIVQIAEDSKKYIIFEELLKKQKNAITLKGFSEYVDTMHLFNYAGIAKQVFAKAEKTGKREIPLGWLRLEGELTTEMELNPCVEKRNEIFVDKDNNDFRNYRLIVLT